MTTAFESVAADFQKLQKGITTNNLNYKLFYTLKFSTIIYCLLDYSKTLSNREQLESQFRENELVLKELKLLKDDSKVFKLIGPALMSQEKVEALTNVEKRIDFIKSEMYV